MHYLLIHYSACQSDTNTEVYQNASLSVEHLKHHLRSCPRKERDDEPTDTKKLSISELCPQIEDLSFIDALLQFHLEIISEFCDKKFLFKSLIIIMNSPKISSLKDTGSQQQFLLVNSYLNLPRETSFSASSAATPLLNVIKAKGDDPFPMCSVKRAI